LKRLWLVLAVVALAMLPATAAGQHSVVELLSPGTAEPPGFPLMVPDDGQHVFFGTAEQLVPEDTDTGCPNNDEPPVFGGCPDVYEHFNGQIHLVSTGPASPNGAFPTGVDAVSADGSSAVFSTQEPLVAEDTDAQNDVYVRKNGVTSLVSKGSIGGNGAFGAGFGGASADGSTVVFFTGEHLEPEDQNACGDIYARSGAVTRLVSTGPGDSPSPPMPCSAFMILNAKNDVSADGQHIFFFSQRPLVAADDDGGNRDIYERVGNATRLVTGPSLDTDQVSAANSWAYASRDGTHAYFATRDRLVAEDADNDSDMYERIGEDVHLLGPPAIYTVPFAGIGVAGTSTDGTRVIVFTSEQLTPADTDAEMDLYERYQGNYILLSTGPADTNIGNGLNIQFPNFATSDDATYVLFATQDRLVAADVDSAQDIYERFNGVTTLVSTGPAAGVADIPAILAGVSRDGTRAVFDTEEPLVTSDTDVHRDVYERFAGNTFIVPFGGNSTGDIYADGRPSAISADGSRVFLWAFPSLSSSDTDNVQDWYAATLAGNGYARPKGATPLQVSLVPAYAGCSSSDRVHGPPLAFPSCSSPDQVSTQLTVGTADSNGKPAKSAGLARFETMLGVPSTPADEADVRVTLELTDVYAQGAPLADYAGEIRVETAVRITDKNNTPAPSGPEAAAVPDTTLGFTVPCAPTPDTTAGATCSVATTMDAVLPGVVPEGKRSVWQLGQVSVLDGGPDGDGDTAGNSLFMVQGIFVP
jgi:hypothetical protein